MAPLIFLDVFCFHKENQDSSKFGWRLFFQSSFSRVYFLRISTFRLFVSKQFFQMAVFGGEIFRHVGEPKGIF